MYNTTAWSFRGRASIPSSNSLECLTGQESIDILNVPHLTETKSPSPPSLPRDSGLAQMLHLVSFKLYCGIQSDPICRG